MRAAQPNTAEDRPAPVFPYMKERLFSMNSLRTKFLSLGLALVMALTATGCAIRTPATVGHIGSVEIPAGIYLLAQYEAYSTAAGDADLATGETADDVAAVLKAECTGEIGGEQVTTDGADYVARLTLRNLQYYAAVEAKFDELGGTLSSYSTSEAAEQAAELYESNSDLYRANGIGQDTLEAYQLNAAKAQSIARLIYGEDGQTPLTDEDYTTYLQDDCLFLDTVQLPLFDAATYAFADEDQSEQIAALAQQCADTLNGWATAEQGRSERYTSMYEAAQQYVPQASEVLGATMESAAALDYVGSSLMTPEDIVLYGSSLTDSVEENGLDHWFVFNTGTAFTVMCAVDPLKVASLETYKAQPDVLTAMKGDEVEQMLYDEGAAMEQALDQSAMNAYKPSNIKYSG